MKDVFELSRKIRGEAKEAESIYGILKACNSEADTAVRLGLLKNKQQQKIENYSKKGNWIAGIFGLLACIPLATTFIPPGMEFLSLVLFCIFPFLAIRLKEKLVVLFLELACSYIEWKEETGLNNPQRVVIAITVGLLIIVSQIYLAAGWLGWSITLVLAGSFSLWLFKDVEPEGYFEEVAGPADIENVTDSIEQAFSNLNDQLDVVHTSIAFIDTSLNGHLDIIDTRLSIIENKINFDQIKDALDRIHSRLEELVCISEGSSSS